MADDLRVADDCVVPLAEIDWRFGPSGGPGGQHANRAHTRVEASFDAAASPSLTDSQRERIVRRLGSPVRVVADDERSQARNRAVALQRLAARLAGALEVPKRRRPTRPGRAAVARRLDAKRRRSSIKRQRARPMDDT
jgi:ribosome-associated protein